MFAILLLLLAAGFTPPQPTTVNGQELGDAEDFATLGPARVCLNDMAVSPKAGETVYLEYLGIHEARLRLVLADGTDVTLAQGTFQDRRSAGQEPAIQLLGQRYYLIGDGASPYYQMVTSDSAPGEFGKLLNIFGTALSGHQSDEQVLHRLSFGEDQVQKCDRRFGYGWHGIFWTTPASDEAE